LLPGGSTAEAQELWARYRALPSHNPDGSRPRSLRISLVHLADSETSFRTGDYWVVHSDHVYQVAFGPGGGGAYVREVDLFQPGPLRQGGSING
jgi:hypothetical protein